MLYIFYLFLKTFIDLKTNVAIVILVFMFSNGMKRTTQWLKRVAAYM